MESCRFDSLMVEKATPYFFLTYTKLLLRMVEVRSVPVASLALEFDNLVKSYRSISNFQTLVALFALSTLGKSSYSISTHVAISWPALTVAFTAVAQLCGPRGRERRWAPPFSPKMGKERICGLTSMPSRNRCIRCICVCI